MVHSGQALYHAVQDKTRNYMGNKLAFGRKSKRRLKEIFNLLIVQIIKRSLMFRLFQ
jgi:hypothetical protein